MSSHPGGAADLEEAPTVHPEPAPSADEQDSTSHGLDFGDQGPGEPASAGEVVADAHPPAAADMALGDVVLGEVGPGVADGGVADVADMDHEPDIEPAGAVPEADLVGALEAVLLVVDSPVTEDSLATAVGHGPQRVRRELEALADRYTDAGSGIELRQVGGGWRFYTRDRFAPVVERFVLDGQQSRLSRAALETLAVIAYRQPVTRARIAGVRGVNVDGVIRTLTARGLIEEVGTDPETGGLLHGTTEQFLERLGLSGLDELPSLGPLLPEIDAIDDV